MKIHKKPTQGPGGAPSHMSLETAGEPLPPAKDAAPQVRQRDEEDLVQAPDQAQAQAEVQAPGDGGRPPATQEGDGQPFVTFYVDKELFAFPMTAVREIIRMPEVVRVPLSPQTLEGVANLRGQMLPIVNLRRTFQFPIMPYDAATRVIVVEEGGIVGFVVDRVSMVITVGKDQQEPVSSIRLAIDTDLLAGLIKGVQGHAMVMLLDVPRLIHGSARSITREDPASQQGASLRPAALGPDPHGSSGQDGRDVASSQAATLAAERHLVSFIVADQEYAFPIERVQEIVQVPDQMSYVPKAESHVLGVMTLRNRLLPLVSLRQMFFMPFEALGPHNRIVVIELSGDAERSGVVGIVTDAVNEVLRVPDRLVDRLPSFLSQKEAGSDIEAICRLSDGKRLVSILSVERLFSHTALREALSAQQGEQAEAPMDKLAEAGAASGEDEKTGALSDDEAQLVVFRLDGQEYGVNIESVQEIIRIPESLTRLPKTAEALVGVVNVRGQVLPVVDLRTRFGLQRMPRDDRQRIMVFSRQGAYTGFIVDSVSEVLKVPRSAVEAVPARSEERAQLIGHIANLQRQKRMILILDAGQLLDSTDLDGLGTALAAAA